MKYCSKCYIPVETARCPLCGSGKLREIEMSDYCFVTEKEEMWAKMFMDLLKDQGIACTSLPAVGTGMTMKAGVMERWKIYVPYEALNQALELLKEAFTS